MEIGPGYGNLTKAIVRMEPKKIFAVEKDKKLAFFLKKKFIGHNNLKIINSDILDIIEKKKFRTKHYCFW